MTQFEPGPDAPEVLQFNPWTRVAELEAKQGLLASNNAQLRRALRKVLQHARVHSDMGMAPWYQEALQALGQRLE